MLAAALSALCLWFAWRAFRRCRGIESGLAAAAETDPLEAILAERELNLQLNLARRNVQALGRAALFGGTGLAFWVAAGGGVANQPLAMSKAFVFGLLGWGGCREFHRRIGSLAESWRATTNRRRRRQGVDQSERTG